MPLAVFTGNRPHSLASAWPGGFYGEQAPFAGFGMAVQAEGFRNGRAGDIGVQNGGFITLALCLNRQQGSNERFADAALAADNADNFFDMAHLIRFFQKAFLRSFAAIFAAAFAFRCNFRCSFRSYASSSVSLFCPPVLAICCRNFIVIVIFYCL